MKHAVIENTDIRVSRIAFGMASLHHLFSGTLRLRIIEAAASSGITHFDTSPYYGFGLAERDLGQFLRGQRAAFTVTTKVGLYPWGAASSHGAAVWGRKALGKLVPAISRPVVSWQVDRARTSLHQSLRRLKTDYVDFVFLHEPDIRLIKAEEFVGWIEAERARGCIRCWGLAGIAAQVAPWVQENHLLAKVVQTQDSINKHQADFMFSCGRNLQFTYGYLSSWKKGGQAETPEFVIRQALQRNTKGAVIVSTLHPELIIQLGQLVP
jgi:aryl-alcohol dehydrogenase-like predicted oxidoreductase